MRLSRSLLFNLKSRKRFKELNDLPTSKIFEELSFVKRYGKDFIKTQLWKNIERKLKRELYSLLFKYEFDICSFPTLQQISLWKKTNRYEKFSSEIIHTEGKQEALFPTSEEPVTNFLSNYIFSYKELPLLLAQFKLFYRDVTTKSIIRLREFQVLDMYSICKTEAATNKIISKIVKPLYKDIFNKLELKLIEIRKREGYIDYKLKTKEGDDKILETGEKAISVAVIIDLKDYYSKIFGVRYVDRDTKIKPAFLGSYAIGIERLLYSIVHTHRTKLRDKPFTIKWPRGFEPFEISIITVGAPNKFSEKVYRILKNRHLDVLYDDTEDSLGIKLYRSFSLGIPSILVIGPREEKEKMVTLKRNILHKEETKMKLSDFLNYLYHTKHQKY